MSQHIHPADRDRVRAAFAATRAVLGSYETDFRILVGDEIRWIAARGKGEDVGIVGRTMFGIFLDVTNRKQAEEGHELLAGEMSHRVKNLLAIAAGLTQITSRTTSSTKDMATELIQRLTALGRAHDLVRPLPDGQGSAALLGDLLSVLLAPYDDLGAFSGRIRVAVERMGVGEKAATSLAMVVHELATNSLKYGRCLRTRALWTCRPTPATTNSVSYGWKGADPPLRHRQRPKALEASWCATASTGNWAGPLPMIGRQAVSS